MKEILVANIANKYRILVLYYNLNVKSYFKTNRERIAPMYERKEEIAPFTIGDITVNLPSTRIIVHGDSFDLNECNVAFSLKGKPYLVKSELSCFNGIKGKEYFDYVLYETENSTLNLDNLKFCTIFTLNEFLSKLKNNKTISNVNINYSELNKEYLQQLEDKINKLQNIEQFKEM